MKMVLLWKSGMGMCVSMPKYFLYFYTYHFLAEAFLAFILLYPITFRYFSHIHYVYYFVIVLLLAGLFFIFIKYQVSTLLYITMLPLAFLLFYFADFPFALMVIFPIVFLWRFMSILRYERSVTDQASLLYRQTINHANKYLKIALVASAIGVVYSKEALVVWFVLALIVVLYVGYFLSHVSMMQQKERQSINFRPLTFIPLVFIFGISFVLIFMAPFRQLMKKIYMFLVTGAIYLFSGVIALLEFIVPERLKNRGETEGGTVSGGETWDESNQFKYHAGIDEKYLTIGMTIILLIVISYIIYRLYHQKRDKVYGRTETETEFVPMHEEEEEKSFFEKIFSSFQWEKRHPVRELIFAFEKDAKKHEVGRRSYESIDEWLHRIEVELEIETYQKVRYGLQNVSDDDVKKLEQQLRGINFKEIKEQQT